MVSDVFKPKNSVSALDSFKLTQLHGYVVRVCGVKCHYAKVGNLDLPNYNATIAEV